MQFSCIFKFFSNIITLHHNNLYHSHVIVFKWIYEYTIDASYFALCSGISPDQISIAKPGFPKVTYAPLERQTCIVERKAGDRNSSRGILSQACVSVCGVFICAQSKTLNVFQEGDALSALLESESRWYFLLVSCNNRKCLSISILKL